MKSYLLSTMFFLACFTPHIYGEENLSKDNCELNAKDSVGYRLVWSEEFDYEGHPNPKYWTAEHGYVRNEEDQWYQRENATCKDGLLHIEARREHFKNPFFEVSTSHWAKKRKYVKYSSASISTINQKSWMYGRFEIRAKIPMGNGLWPAIWLLGISSEWPSCGEIDIMEYYDNSILANAAWGTRNRWKAKWDSSKTPMSHFLEKDPNWAEKFHLWRMDWTSDYIKIYLDDELLNTIDVTKTVNADGTNPFRQPHYLLLNLALGGINGGNPDLPKYPVTYYVDFVRVYQKDTSK